MSLDKRKKARKRINVSVNVKKNAQLFDTAKVFDLSSSGLSIITDKNAVELGDIFFFDFTLPINQKLVKIEVLAQVMRVNPFEDSKFMIGLSYVNLDALASLTINNFLSTRASVDCGGLWTSMYTR